MKVGFVIVLLFLFSFTVIGQNLVKNPGFEECSIESRNRHDTYKLQDCEYWNSSIQYDNYECCSHYLHVFPGGHIDRHRADIPKPRSGNGMAGISPSFYDLRNKKKPKYGGKLVGQLNESLTEDQLYCVSFYFYFYQDSWYPVEELAVVFISETDSFHATYDGFNLAIEPHVSLTDSTLSITGRWHCFTHTYQAKGGENAFIIGNFKQRVYNPKETPISGRRIKTGKHAGKTFWDYNIDYYYIDDVAVFPISDSSECPCKLSNW